MAARFTRAIRSVGIPQVGPRRSHGGAALRQLPEVPCPAALPPEPAPPKPPSAGPAPGGLRSRLCYLCQRETRGAVEPGARTSLAAGTATGEAAGAAPRPGRRFSSSTWPACRLHTGWGLSASCVGGSRKSGRSSRLAAPRAATKPAMSKGRRRHWQAAPSTACPCRTPGGHSGWYCIDSSPWPCLYSRADTCLNPSYQLPRKRGMPGGFSRWPAAVGGRPCPPQPPGVHRVLASRPRPVLGALRLGLNLHALYLLLGPLASRACEQRTDVLFELGPTWHQLKGHAEFE